MPQHFVHLRATERTIWQRALDAGLFPIDSKFQYDLRLGEGMPISPTWPAWLQTMATELTQRRGDVVVTTPAAVIIVELKQRASTSAVGQLLTYRELYRAYINPNTIPQLAIVATEASFDLAQTLAAFEINLYLV